MKVELIAHTQLSNQLISLLPMEVLKKMALEKLKSGQVISLAAIRECYSHKTALEVLETESEKYFGDKGQEGKRLFNHIVKSGHTSTLEHIHFTFAVEGVSRALLAQLTRHRQLSFSVQSQRYTRLSSDSRSGGFNYVKPHTITSDKEVYLDEHISVSATTYFEDCMLDIQNMYDQLIKAGIPQEDARAVLPNAATCNLVVSGNLRAWLEFYSKRKPGNGGQLEITQFAEHIKKEILEVEPWLEEYFNL